MLASMTSYADMAWSRRGMIVGSFLTAAAAFLTEKYWLLLWRLVHGQWVITIGHALWLVLFAFWFLLVVLTFHRHRLSGFWTLLGAPLAFFFPAQLVMWVAVCAFGSSCG